MAEEDRLKDVEPLIKHYKERRPNKGTFRDKLLSALNTNVDTIATDLEQQFRYGPQANMPIAYDMLEGRLPNGEMAVMLVVTMVYPPKLEELIPEVLRKATADALLQRQKRGHRYE